MTPSDNNLAARTSRLETSSFLYAVRPIATDLASTFFFYGVLALTGDPRVAAGISIGLGIAQILWMKFQGRSVAPLQWASTIMVVVFGGLTIVTHDPRFVLVKVTVFYAAFGVTMLRPGWMTRYIPNIAHGHIPEHMVVFFERAWAGLMLCTGAVNLILALTADPRATALIMVPLAIGSKVVLFLGQYALFRAIARPRIKAARASSAE